MFKALKRRRLVKSAKDVLRHGRHVLNMREDIMAPADRDRVVAAMDRLREAVAARAEDEIEPAADRVIAVVQELSPKRAFPGVRENVEVVVVAVAVAMGFRTYYLQPFKIPTGSMQPTLYGIHSQDGNGPGLLDRFPIKYAKWIVTGEMHHVIQAKTGGTLSKPAKAGPYHPASLVYHVGMRPYRLPKYAMPRFRPGEYVPAGAVLWEGTITAGDHVFVNKVAWNFRRPRRGEIMVFSTDGIRGIQPGTHYIKRLAALPGEKVAIHPPHLVVDDDRVTEPDSIARIAEKAPGYAGYQLTRGADVLTSPYDVFHVGEDQYFALGDNTLNSRDGRYWGAVPEDNMVGPALLVYWPLSRRWGLAD